MRGIQLGDFSRLGSPRDDLRTEKHRYIAFIAKDALGAYSVAIKEYPESIVMGEYEKASKLPNVLVIGPLHTFVEARHAVKDQLSVKLMNLKRAYQQLIKIKNADCKYQEGKHV